MHAGGLVRTLHVLAALVVVLGALAAAARPSLARRVEWAFWAAAIALVVTGFGNVAALGGAAGGAWGARFGWKLGLVAALLLLSAWRAMVVVLGGAPRAILLANGLTATLAVGIVSLGLVLAHA